MGGCAPAGGEQGPGRVAQGRGRSRESSAGVDRDGEWIFDARKRKKPKCQIREGKKSLFSTRIHGNGPLNFSGYPVR